MKLLSSTRLLLAMWRLAVLLTLSARRTRSSLRSSPLSSSSPVPPFLSLTTPTILLRTSLSLARYLLRVCFVFLLLICEIYLQI
ncbi:hypothetical protein LINPERPRIM_LOCUS13489 [Linum perenne]